MHFTFTSHSFHIQFTFVSHSFHINTSHSHFTFTYTFTLTFTSFHMHIHFYFTISINFTFNSHFTSQFHLISHSIHFTSQFTLLHISFNISFHCIKEKLKACTCILVRCACVFVSSDSLLLIERKTFSQYQSSSSLSISLLGITEVVWAFPLISLQY